MAKKASGGGQGAHLASGYISLNVKYGSAMGQIASDFGILEKKSKAAGESITRNLVAGADQAKAKVAQLGSEYEAQRSKVAALRAEVDKLHSTSTRMSQAQQAYSEGRKKSLETQHAFTREQILLETRLAKATESGTVQSIKAKLAALDEKRKADLKELAALEKEAVAARKASTDSTSSATTVQKALDEEIAKGKQLFEQYGRAVEDAARKQDLAKASADGLKNGMGQSLTLGQRFARMIGLPFGRAGEDAGSQAGQGFRRNFSMQMYKASGEATQHARSLANGLLMGMTPGVMGAAGVGLAVGKAFQAGFDREETLNTTKMRMQALGRSAGEIQSIMDTALKSVEGTQFTLAESFTAASTAMSAGIKPGKDMEQYLNNIANAAGLTGQSFGVVADSINRVQMQSVVSLENLEPLIKKDLPVLKWLKEFYQKDFPNTTTQDIMDMISKKLIPADVLQKVLTKNLNDGMKGLTRNTTRGALTDLWTQVGKVTQSILQPFMGDWPTMINSLGDKLKNFAVYIKPGMQTFATWLKTTWNTLWPKLSHAVGVAVDWIKEKWQEWWPSIKVVIDKVVNTVREMWPQLKEHFQPWLNAIKRLWDNLYPIVAPIVKLIGGLAGWLALEFIKHMPAFMQFATNLINWMATALEWLRTKFWPWLKEMWAKLTEAAEKSWKKIGEWKTEFLAAFNKVKDTLTGWFDWIKGKWEWLQGLQVPDWVKWLAEKFGINLNSPGGQSIPYNLTSSSTPLTGPSPMPGAMPGGTYGLSPNTAINYGAPGFPSWVYAVGKAFNLQASTYVNHQGGKGIDWAGSVEDMQRFADYLTKIPTMEQVIFSNPDGRRTGVANGQRVGPGTSQPGYYRDDWGGHFDHVHTRMSTPIPLPANVIDASAFGGIALQNFSIPLSGGNGAVPQPPSPTPGTIGGIPIPGLMGGAPATLPDAIGQATPEPRKGFWDYIIDGLNPGKVLNPDWWIGQIFGEPDLGTPALGIKQPGGGKTYTFPGAPNDKPGPSGTPKDPITTNDPKVAANTDPNNPDAGKNAYQSGKAGDSNAAAAQPDSAHAGSGAAPGPVSTAPGSKGDGKNAENLIGGLAGVGQTAFSNQFEGTPFSNPLDWPTTKSAGALLSFFGSLLSGNASGGASGLASLFSPGSATALDYKDQRQIRDSGQRLDRLNKARDKAKQELDAMQGKPQYTPEEKAEAAEKYAQAQQEATDALQDHNELLREMNQKASGGAGGGLRGWIQSLMNPNPMGGNGIGDAAAAASLPGGGSSVFSPEAFGNPLNGQPGAPNPGAPILPGGGGSPIAAAAGAIPSLANAAPAVNNSGGQPNIDMSVHQTVPVEGQAAAQDVARRAQTTQLRGPLLTTGTINV